MTPWLHLTHFIFPFVPQTVFEVNAWEQSCAPRACCFPWNPKRGHGITEGGGVPRFEDTRYSGLREFKKALIARYDFPDMSLITKKENLQYMLQQYSSKMTTGEVCLMLKKSTFFSPEGFIIGEGLQKIAMNANRRSAFRFCPISQNDSSIRSRMLKESFLHIYDLCEPVLRSASAEIAREYPLMLPWFTDISITSLLGFRHGNDRCLCIDQISATAVSVMVRYWLSHPEMVYEYTLGVAPPRVNNQPGSSFVGVSDRIVRNGLRNLCMLLRDRALSPELSTMERQEIRAEVADLLGCRDWLAAYIRSWCNKLAVLSMGGGGGDSRRGIPLVDCSKARALVYTADMARACFDEAPRLLFLNKTAPRRGDTVLRLMHDARREDLCVTVIPLIAQYILTPTPTRFAPRWPAS